MLSLLIISFQFHRKSKNIKKKYLRVKEITGKIYNKLISTVKVLIPKSF